MNISAYFINRPVATSLLTLAITLAGIIAFFQLPVAPLPQVDFPTISVQAALPGASPEVMSTSVATPLERTLGRIAGITEITSSSTLGSTSITLQFELNRDIDGAARDVQAAINAAANLLPANMPTQPRYQKVNPADSPIMIIALTSDTLPKDRLYDVASTILAQKIAQVQGIGQVYIGGSAPPAVRINLNPNSMAKYGISFEEVRAAINGTNVNRPKGMLEDARISRTLYANDQAKSASEYLPLIVAYRNGAPVFVRDLGYAEDSLEDLRSAGFKDNKPAVLLILNKQSGANIIETVDKIKALLPQLRASIPKAIDLSMVLDRSISIRASLDEVEFSLVLAVVLVILVVFLFLRNPSSALIPIITVPVSLIATFGIMYLFGYSLDNLSLMALTIATGFVVDDAIVVLENTMRHLEQGVEPKEAALKGAGEVSFTVLSMSLSLIAVFIPILLMGGIVGRLFQEFAVTLSAAVMISLVISLTTTPMLCALWLKPETEIRHNRFYNWSENLFKRWLNAYEHSLHWALAHAPWVMLILLATIALNIYLYIIVPKGFFPVQDTGRLTGTIQADMSISSEAMKQKLADFVDIVLNDPEVSTLIGFTGGQRNMNGGVIFATLKPLADRELTIDQLMARLRQAARDIPGAKIFMQPPQDLRIGARGSSALFEYALQADQLDDLKHWIPQLVRALSQKPELVDVNTNQQDQGRQVELTIDRNTASRLGLTQAAITTALNNAFGQRQVSVIYNPLSQYRVVLGVAPEYSQSAQALNNIYIKQAATAQNPAGGLVPLAAVTKSEISNAPLSVNHQSQFPTGTISFNLKPGTSLSAATQIINDTMREIGVPASLRGGFQGTARAFEQSLKDQPLLIVAALATIYIVLGMLYESYIHPLTILSTLPSAGVGAILALLAFETDFTIIAMIGVILLIGVVKKNAIMMIDFAIDAERRHHIPPDEAVFSACMLRFRPIMMTTFAALLAALPLALGTGYGAELRQPLGISIMGGLILSQMLTLYSTPVVYLYLDRFQSWLKRIFKRNAHSLSA